MGLFKGVIGRVRNVVIHGGYAMQRLDRRMSRILRLHRVDRSLVEVGRGGHVDACILQPDRSSLNGQLGKSLCWVRRVEVLELLGRCRWVW